MEMFTLGQNIDFVTLLNSLSQIEGLEQEDINAKAKKIGSKIKKKFGA